MGDEPRENAARRAASAFAWWRLDLPLEHGFRYWRDVHGPVGARCPGLFQYSQRHLSPLVEGEWPAIAGVETSCPGPEQPNGLCELLFRSPEDERIFEESPFVADYIAADERNHLLRNVTYLTGEDGCRTLLDGSGRPQPQGAMPTPAWVVCLKRAEGVEAEAFGAYVRDQLAPAWAGAAAVVRVRWTLLEPYDPSDWESDEVEHDWAPERQYQAWVEVVAEDRSALPQLAAVSGLAEHVRALHAFPIDEHYTMVHDGRPTLVGLRSWPVVQAIDASGAENQRSAALLEAVFGPVVHGAVEPPLAPAASR